MVENGRFGDLFGVCVLMWEIIGNDILENLKVVCYNWFIYVELYIKDLIDKYFLKIWLGKFLVVCMIVDNIFWFFWLVK